MISKIAHYLSLPLTLCLTLLASGACSDFLDADRTTEKVQQGANNGFTLEKAKSVFEAEYDDAMKVPMDEVGFESPFVWESGDILPIWKLAERHEDISSEYFSVPILTSTRYYATSESRKNAELITCRQELLISRKASGKTTSRIVFHISTDNTQSDDDRTHFTGLLVYTNLNGKFRKIEQYENGVLVNGVYFGEKESYMAGERHFILVNQIMEGITIFKVGSPSVTLRSAPTEEIYDTIAGSICIDRNPDRWWLDPAFWFYNQGTGEWEFCPDTSYVGSDSTYWPGGNGGHTSTDSGNSGVEHSGNNGSNQNNSVPRPMDLSESIGKDDYYSQRFEDYKDRLKDKADENIYYISYGKKYYEAFKQNAEKMSPKGQKWVEATAINLQQMMESLLKANPNIESDPDALYQAAFQSHPEAYIKAGFLNLDMSDKLIILMTIELNDLLSDEGLKQVFAITGKQISYYLTNPNAAINDAKYIVNNIDNIFEDICSYFINNIRTRSSVENLTEMDIFELLLGEQINYFYDNIAGFAMPDSPYFINYTP